MFPKFSQIKEDARICLKGIWGKTALKEFILFLVGAGGMTFGMWLTELVYLIVINVISSFSQDETYKTFVGSITIFVIIHLVVSLIQMFVVSGMKLGMKKYYLELAHNPYEEPKSGLVSHIKYFQNYFSMTAIKEISIYFLSLFLIIPGLMSGMKWAMTPYVTAEDHETSAKDSMVESGYLMDGHKIKYLLFNLSFIGWYIIGSITIVGLFFVIPYVEAARAKYYYYIKHPVYDKDADLNDLKTLRAEKFSFDDFVSEYNTKIEKKNKLDK
jgi:uncharacterized membrane protein